MSVIAQTVESRAGTLKIIVSFVFLMSIILLGPNPFSAFSALESADSDGSGNGFRQSALLLSIIMILVFSGVKSVRPFLRSLPIEFWIFFLWAGVTLLWSPVPDVGFRRLALMALVSAAIFVASDAIGERKTLELAGQTVFVFLIMDIVAALFLPGGVHGIYEKDQALVGLWKGFHGHKNIASSVAFFGIIFSFTHLLFERKVKYALYMLVAIVVLLGAASKATLAFLPMCFFVTVFIFAAAKSSAIGRFVLKYAFFAAIVALAITGYIYRSEIFMTITQPLFLTGRGYLWYASLSYSISHIWGAGYGSFWDVGSSVAPPAGKYIAYVIAEAAPHGHNGYLDILAATGLVGLLLSIWICCIRPLQIGIERMKASDPLVMISFCFILYFILNNLIETSIFAGGRIDWLLFLVSFAVLRKRVLPLSAKAEDQF